MEERSFSATLSTNQRWHAFIAVKGVHLKPVGYHRQKPGTEVSLLFRGDTWQTTKELADRCRNDELKRYEQKEARFYHVKPAEPEEATPAA